MLSIILSTLRLSKKIRFIPIDSIFRIKPIISDPKIEKLIDVPRWNSVNGEISANVDSAIDKFSCHPSIIKIRNDRQDVDTFELSQVTNSETLKVLKHLNDSKSVSRDIPTKIIKLAKYVCAPTLTACFNHSLETCDFPDSFKMADIIPCHKKNSKHDKDNYRPVSLLPSSAKVFEKLISNQLDPGFILFR